MLELKREIYNNKFVPKEMFNIIDKDKKQEFEIFYMDNGDLYFSTFNQNEKDTNFIINRTDFELYRVFNNLFMYLDDDTNKYDSKDMKKVIYNKEKRIIKVLSDDLVDYNSNLKNELVIVKEKENFKIVFINKSTRTNTCGIRFNTDRSIYGNLIFLFTNLHTELNELYDCYQLDIEDCIELKKLQKKVKP